MAAQKWGAIAKNGELQGSSPTNVADQTTNNGSLSGEENDWHRGIFGVPSNGFLNSLRF
jgi:hypothetical protein